MPGPINRDSPDSDEEDEVNEYARQKEEAADKRESFLRKYYHRNWPKRIVAVVGVLELLISLATFGVDLPVMLMNAPRWQVLTGLWSLIFGFISCVATLHTIRKVTWVKLQVAAALNILCALVSAIMLIFNIMFAANPYTCIIASGCNYLKYTYTQGTSFYIGEIVLNILLIATTIVFLVLFAKYGIGGKTRFENIQRGYGPSNFNPRAAPNYRMPMRPNGPPNGMNRGALPIGYNPRFTGQPRYGAMGGPGGPMGGRPPGPRMPPNNPPTGAYPSLGRPQYN